MSKPEIKLAVSISSSRSLAPAANKGTGRSCALSPCYRFGWKEGWSGIMEGK